MARAITMAIKPIFLIDLIIARTTQRRCMGLQV